ncbi:hypothetical protein [Actinomycetospora termitidis]|uniref:DUF1453 domain-containing protein n=1 Tax=Actinomycetospora termitidis TaxID=3053470 RepID=A0ABT7MC65_9PSEU|nr:hypothetical protein [Actinomycetospora sp. Odt1-22]MDL5158271.1 hypothetical protein [Actinomycetospora sp. Odt1-22]
MNGTLSAVLGIAVLVWVVYNQLRVREFTPRRVRVAAVLGVIGLVQVASAAADAPVSTLGWTLLVTGLVVGGLLGLLRARTMKLWVADGTVFTQGHWGTAALWIVGIAAHVGLDLLARLVAPSAATVNAASILLFVGVSLGAQGLVTMSRARSLPGAPAMTLERVR